LLKFKDTKKKNLIERVIIEKLNAKKRIIKITHKNGLKHPFFLTRGVSKLMPVLFLLTMFLLFLNQ
jgi:hypothetical protein